MKTRYEFKVGDKVKFVGSKKFFFDNIVENAKSLNCIDTYTISKVKPFSSWTQISLKETGDKGYNSAWFILATLKEKKFKIWSFNSSKFLDNGQVYPLITLMTFWQSIFPNPGRIVLVEYVGIEDSKGVEIYDGDIVTCNPVHGPNIKYQGVIRFCKKYGNYGVVITEPKYKLHLVNSHEIPKPFFNYVDNNGKIHLTVIGSSYEKRI